MADKTTIGISSLISLGIITLFMIVPGLFDEPKYFCESRPEIGLVSCDSFSKYVSPNGKCIREDNTNLICRDGWLLLTDDRKPEETELPPETVGKQYSCSPIECMEI